MNFSWHLVQLWKAMKFFFSRYYSDNIELYLLLYIICIRSSTSRDKSSVVVNINSIRCTLKVLDTHSEMVVCCYHTKADVSNSNQFSDPHFYEMFRRHSLKLSEKNTKFSIYFFFNISSGKTSLIPDTWKFAGILLIYRE